MVSAHSFARVPAVLAASSVLITSAGAQCQDELFELYSPTPASFELFGASVAAHGSVGLLGVPGEDLVGMDSGTAVLRDLVTGAFLQKLVASDASPLDQFGGAVAMDSVGILIGAAFDDVQGVRSGSAYVFDAATGLEQHKLVPTGGAAEDLFGVSVAIEGSTALIGALGAGSAGSAFVFDAASGAQLLQLQPGDGSPSDQFGTSVALNGSTAYVGSFFHTPGAFNSAGAVYTYDVATGAPMGKLVPDDPQPMDGFGRSVASAGDLVLVGAPRVDDQGQNSGAAYVFDRVSGNQLFKLLPSDGMTDRFFGTAVDLDGTLAVIGGIKVAYLFDLTTGLELRRYTRSDAQPAVDLGSSVAIHGNRAVVGSSADEDLGSAAGSAYVYSTELLGTVFCTSTANSTGAAGLTSACGSPSLAANDLTLTAGPVPNSMALFFYGNVPSQVPFGDGIRCAGGSIVRIGGPATSSGQTATRVVDLPAASIVTAGTLYFQCWFRDPAAMGSGFNTSDGLEITFVP